MHGFELTDDSYKLPNDWIELKTNKGEIYYACLTTKHTQLLPPNIAVGTMMPTGLPYGWEKNIIFVMSEDLLHGVHQ